ncbi:WGR domain-containing protein [Sinirhodobacter populi]|uniref:WGR domain-containing protein n=1 Tax=Paenirhodobacter populi TaxID=2306993 RepID=A0A443K4L0_9RHOB|nr:WGR domain-containing protein [Sinirhodobacter populi]RWR27672.1 WGR domain-containing protein [Sinirhodobacter populi]
MQQDDHRSFHLLRIDTGCNMHRFYTASIQPTLFGGVSVIRNWGRIGSSGRMRIDTFDEADQANNALDKLIRTKRRRGYRSAEAIAGGQSDAEPSDLN